MNGALTIFVTGQVDDERLAELRDTAPEADITHFETADAMQDRIGEARIVAGSVGPRVLDRAERLEWVHSWAAGPDPQLFPAFVESDIVLTCSKGNGAAPLAEHAMMLMLMLNRNALRWIEAHRKGRWDRFSHGELNGQTVCIIGTGYSGSDLARKCRAFYMTTLGVNRTGREVANFDAVYPPDALPDLLSRSDVVVVTAPLTPETRGMIGEAEFHAMKPSAFFICLSRGGVANSDALYRAVDEGWIAGAGLDAHEVEPLSRGDRFWKLKNTIVTPA